MRSPTLSRVTNGRHGRDACDACAPPVRRSCRPGIFHDTATETYSQK